MRGFLTFCCFVTALGLAARTAAAGFSVEFLEAAPKDRFIVTNGTSCDFRDGAIEFDLRSSKSGLIFDTVPAGAGENVAQPFEIARAEGVQATVTKVQDGAAVARLNFETFAPGGTLELTVDVDDSVRSGPRGVQMIDTTELAGVRIALTDNSGVVGSAEFDSRGFAHFDIGVCPQP
jgi:hypothetical protein